MTTFRKLLAVVSVGLVALAILSFGSQPEFPSDLQGMEVVGAAACHGCSAKCIVVSSLRAHRRCAWRRYAWPAGSTARQAPIRRW